MSASSQTKEKIYTDLTLGEIRVRKSSRTGRFSIRVSPRSGIIVGIPWWASFKEGLAFLVSKKDWVLKTVLSQRAKLAAGLPEGWEGMSESERKAYVDGLRKEAKAFLPGRMTFLSGKYGFSFSSLRIKHNLSSWGSCSTKGNINLNLNIMRLTSEERDYVMLHELCHLRYMNHGESFHALLDSLCRAETGTGARELEKRLKRYTLV